MPWKESLLECCVLLEDNRPVEFLINPVGQASFIGDIYVGKVEKIQKNIGAAFVAVKPDMTCYFPLSEEKYLIYARQRNGNPPLRVGDEILVQISKEAIKTKLPSVTANLSLTGEYLVFTSGKKKIGFSTKLSGESKLRLQQWLQELLPDNPAKNTPDFGIIVRTNAEDASMEAFRKEFLEMSNTYRKCIDNGKMRTCYSRLYQKDSFVASVLKEVYKDELEEIVTDQADAIQLVKNLLPDDICQTRYYQDPLLPLYKLYSLESVLEELTHEKVWLKSGGFLVIQQTEAFVSIDVNTGKNTEKKKSSELFRKVNLEAAKEIARQLRLRNLSGAILIDFVNMENQDHIDELFHVFQKCLRKDRVKTRAIDITPLHIMEVTRQKIRKPLMEQLSVKSPEKSSNEMPKKY
ncbi:MAG: ribonuclease E/G [Blautia sp.]|nr:ribonuclease E/G [Blautia sp.]